METIMVRERECTNCKKPVAIKDIHKTVTNLVVVAECQDCEIEYLMSYLMPTGFDLYNRFRKI